MPIAPRDLKKHLTQGGKAINGWCCIPSPVTAEIMARQGFDTISVDLQHGLIDYQTALGMVQVVSNLQVATLCRVPWNEPGIIMKVLDAGFAGVICPMINNADEAQRFARACLYAPRGFRSFGPTRAGQVYGADYAEKATDIVCAFAMIETREALQNLDAILAVDGIDGVYIGPADLSLSLGYKPSLLPTDAEVLDAIALIHSKAKAAGKIAGIHCGSPEMIREKLAYGFDLASLITDIRVFMTAMAAQVATARGGPA
jgi:4-hydroxy-2-oxoheptanedioate aldolase